MNRGFIGALSLSVAAALLSACGASPLPTEATVSVATHSAAHGQKESGKVADGSSSGDLIYATDGSKIYIYSYPEGSLVAQITSYFEPYGACADTSGNVYVITHIGSGYQAVLIEEFAHGGTTPIASIAVPITSSDCAADPSSTSFAVTSSSGLSVFKSQGRSPHQYDDSSFWRFDSCSYDSQGNVFISGLDRYRKFILAELPKGEHSLVNIATDIKTDDSTAVQWDGEHLAVFIVPDRRGGTLVKQLDVSGTSAHTVGKVKVLPKKHGYFRQPYGWIDGSTLLWTYNYNYFGAWDYTAGGKPQLVKKVPQSQEMWAIVLSRPPGV